MQYFSEYYDREAGRGCRRCGNSINLAIFRLHGLASARASSRDIVLFFLIEHMISMFRRCRNVLV